MQVEAASYMDTERYRTGPKRLWAAIVDWVVFLPLLLVAKWLYKTTSNIVILFAWETFFVFAPLAYSVLLHYKYGQTIGKWVASVKVLDVSETRTLTLRQALYRDSFYLIIGLIGFGYYLFLMARTDDPVTALNDYSSFSDNAVFWWTIIELLTMLTNAKRRAVHDFMAKSVVIRTRTST